MELGLRSTLSPRRATGYEINFRAAKIPNAYSEIVRWNGPLGSFTYSQQRQGLRYGVGNGGVVEATVVGNVITTYLNGVQILQVTDNTFPSGSPGMGFYIEGIPGAGVDTDYGFTSFKAISD